MKSGWMVTASKMNILLTNDDGIYAPGLWALYDRFAADHSVTVVAPDRERSAVSHGITLLEPLRADRIRVMEGREGYAVSGKPADCMKLAMTDILDIKPDLVIAGINPGANVGVSINYSGTVAAAREAALFGIPAIAVSIHAYEVKHYEDAAAFVARLARRILKHGLPLGTVLNVNIPDLAPEKIKGVRLTRQGIEHLSGEYYEKRVDPRNRAYHWLGSDTRIFGEDINIDGDAVSLNYISVTPLKCDSTDYDLLNELDGWGVEES